MAVSSLGYIVVEATDLGAWRRFAVDVLGLMEGQATGNAQLELRVDERPFRIVVVSGAANRFVSAGWEFPNKAAFEDALESLRSEDVKVRLGSTAEAAARRALEIAYCADPCGNQMELYFGRALDYTPFASSRGVTGFVAGDLGMGHVVLPAPDLETTRAFYRRHFGFGDTDEMWLAMSPTPGDPKLGIYFMHAANRRHHSLALMGGPAPSGCVHFMLEVRTLDDVGYALDRCVSSGAHISSSLGKHSNDFMVSFYVQTPGGFDLELGCDGLQPNWDTWVPTHSLIPDLWGHRWSPAPAT